MMCLMDRDWARLGSALRAARQSLGLEQQQVAERIGVKRGALRNIEVGEIGRVTPTVREYARIVGWTDRSIDDVLDGGEPEAAPNIPPAASTDVTPEDLPVRITAALAAAGPVLDTAVINLPGEDGEDGGAQMVVVVKGRSTATPEQIQKALLEWERTEAQIRRSSSE